ncbi:MAG: hypothetical protein ACPIOQ_64160, partial [Promethearchaeia archaeon]
SPQGRVASCLFPAPFCTVRATRARADSMWQPNEGAAAPKEAKAAGMDVDAPTNGAKVCDLDPCGPRACARARLCPRFAIQRAGYARVLGRWPAEVPRDAHTTCRPTFSR